MYCYIYVMLIVYYSVPADRMRAYGNKELCFIHECILGTYDSTWDKEVIQNLTRTVASKSAYGVINSCNIYDTLSCKIPLVTKAILSQNTLAMHFLSLRI